MMKKKHTEAGGVTGWSRSKKTKEERKRNRQTRRKIANDSGDDYMSSDFILFLQNLEFLKFCKFINFKNFLN